MPSHYPVQLSLLLFSLFTLIHAQGFSFTAPPAGNQLNLSAPITIAWTATDPQFPQFDLSFQGPGFGYGLQENRSSSTGNYTWDPAEISRLLQGNKIKLPYGNQYYFLASLHENSTRSGPGAGIKSGMYSVTGYPFLGSAVSLHGRGTIGVLTVVALVGSWLVV